MKTSANRREGIGRVAAIFMLVFAAAMLLAVPSGWAKSRTLRFRVVPAAPLPEPQQTVIRVGDVEISRAEFAFYLKEFLAFPEKGDLLQRNFLYHYALISRLAAQYPLKLDEVIWRAMISGEITPENRANLNKWVLGQADLFGRMKVLADRHRLEQPSRLALDTYLDDLLVEQLGEVVRRGGLVPDRAGVIAFFQKLTPAEKLNVELALRRPSSIKPYEQDELEQRWQDYQKAIAASVTIDRPYQKIESLAALDPNTRLAGVGQLEVTYQDLLIIHGKPVNDVNWNKIKGSRLSQIIAINTLATEAKSLGMADENLKRRIELARLLYLAVDWAAMQYDKTAAAAGLGFNDDYFARLSQTAPFAEFAAWFHQRSREVAPKTSIWIDVDFLSSVEWKVTDLQETEITSRILTTPFGAGADMNPDQATEPQREL